MFSEHPPLSPAWITVLHMRAERLAKEEEAKDDLSSGLPGGQASVDARNVV